MKTGDLKIDITMPPPSVIAELDSDRADPDDPLYEPKVTGYTITWDDLEPVPGSPDTYTWLGEEQEITITVRVQPDGTTRIGASRDATVVENTLHA